MSEMARQKTAASEENAEFACTHEGFQVDIMVRICKRQLVVRVKMINMAYCRMPERD